MSDTSRFVCTVLRQSPQAVQVQHNGSTAWLPRSQIEQMSIEPGGHAEIVVPYWIYKDRFERPDTFPKHRR